jgi:hypothetical protein
MNDTLTYQHMGTAARGQERWPPAPPGVSARGGAT